jgi:hypothetical protein
MLDGRLIVWCDVALPKKSNGVEKWSKKVWRLRRAVRRDCSTENPARELLEKSPLLNLGTHS